ncbi:zeta toxin family protein [bacterium]|nr:zeta toxin family protein [bacterium]
MEKNKSYKILDQVAALLRQKAAGTQAPYLIAIGGPGGSGKSTFARQLATTLGEAVILGLDDYKTSRDFRRNAGVFGPHPDANKMDLIKAHLAVLKRGSEIQKPIYDKIAGDALHTERFSPDVYTLVEGEVATYPRFKALIDFSIYIDSGLLTQLAARLGRDRRDRGHSKEKAAQNFLHSNLREFPAYGAQSRHWADVRLFCREDYCLEWEPQPAG